MHRPTTIALTISALASALATPHSASPIKPSHEAAKDNAYHIFNAIHSAGRQWGSSFYHNGFSFFPAVMPKGTLTYHGGRTPEPPPYPEWLAFEIEHAEVFALSRRLPPRHPNGTDDGDEEIVMRGYFHTYRANRDLNLLYIDGMSAGKTNMGTLDSQDLIMRENNTNGGDVLEEWERALDLCDAITRWGYDGVIRDEMGFEVIYCDFSDGLDFLSAPRTYLMEDRLGTPGDMRAFQLVRAIAERYDGIGGDRLRIDFSSMVSGFFFPINISSTDQDRPDLIRLAAAPLSELKDIKTYLSHVATQPRRFNINWQALVDMIVARFTDRFALMGAEDGVSVCRFIDELEAATLLYVDAPSTPEDETLLGTDHEKPNETEKAIERCHDHYLLPALAQRDAWSLEDELIYTSMSTVTKDICQSLFTMRTIFLELSEAASYKIDRAGNQEGLELAFDMSRSLMRSMIEGLGWTTWKAARRCPVDEVSFIAMWPLGSKEDHWNPGCRSIEVMADTKSGYWTNRDLQSRPDAPSANDEL